MRAWLLFAPLLLCSCAGLSNRPSIDLVRTELATTKKIVSFTSNKTPDEIQQTILANPCGPGEKTMSTLASPGSNIYVPVSTTMQFSVDHGEFQDGRKWVVLRGDDVLHMAASGVVLTPIPEGTGVQVLKADKRKIDVIKQSVEDGTLFCHWREFDYPYD